MFYRFYFWPNGSLPLIFLMSIFFFVYRWSSDQRQMEEKCPFLCGKLVCLNVLLVSCIYTISHLVVCVCVCVCVGVCVVSVCVYVRARACVCVCLLVQNPIYYWFSNVSPRHQGMLEDDLIGPSILTDVTIILFNCMCCGMLNKILWLWPDIVH